MEKITIRKSKKGSKYFFAISAETLQPAERDREGRIIVHTTEAGCARAVFDLYGDRIPFLVGGMSEAKFEKFKANEQYVLVEDKE